MLRLLLATSAIFALSFTLPVHAEEVFSSNDARVLAAALGDFAVRKDTMISGDGYFAVRNETKALSKDATEAGLGASLGKVKPLVDSSLLSAFIVRNQTSLDCESVKDLLGDNWRFVGPKEADAIGFRNQEVRSTLQLGTPGYSADGKRALVLFSFTWSIHGAYAIYVLENEGGSWRVLASDLMFSI